MTRLYWRIFLTFWAVILLVLTLAFTGNSIVFRAEIDHVRLESLREALDALAEQAERQLQRDGEAGLRQWLRGRLRERPAPRLLVIGPDGSELLGRDVPPVTARAIERRQTDSSRDRGPRHRGRLAMRTIEDANGARYLMVTAPAPPRPGGLFLRPQARGWVLLLAVTISGLICLALARHLTQPVQQIRLAGQRLSDGDLAARVDERTVSRRDELGALARDFNRMAERIERLLAGQARLLRDVSHELRSPLARLQAAAGLLRQRAASDDLQHLERIEAETERLNRMIGQILSLTRLQGMDRVAATEIDPLAMLQETIDDASFEAEAHGRQIDARLPDRLEPLRGDQAMLRSAIENVIRNAIEHAQHRVRVRVAAEGVRGLRITVADDGPGADPAALPRLFETFYAAPGTRARQGSGLGLAIARRAVELHEGTITACNGDSQYQGLMVTIRLPGSPAGDR